MEGVAGESSGEGAPQGSAHPALSWAALHSRRFSCEIAAPKFELKLGRLVGQKFHNLSPLNGVWRFPEFAIALNIMLIQESVHSSLHRLPDPPATWLLPFTQSNPVKCRMRDNHGGGIKVPAPSRREKEPECAHRITITFVAVRESAVGTPSASAGGEAKP
jgi:hypothetical protein